MRRYTRPIPAATQNQSEGPQPTTQTPVITVRRLDISRGDCPLLNQPVPIIAGKLHHTLDVETPVGKEMLDDFLSKLLRAERGGAKLYAKLQKERQQSTERRYNQSGSRPYGGSKTQPVTPNTSGTSNQPKKAVSFVKGPRSVTPAQTRSCTRGAAPARTQPKIAGQLQTKPIIKTDPDVGAAVREVQLEDEEPYMEDELEDLANLPTDSEPNNLGDLNLEAYDDIDPVTMTTRRGKSRGEETPHKGSEHKQHQTQWSKRGSNTS